MINKQEKKEIVRKVQKFLDAGYRQILIRDDQVYASGGIIDLSEEQIENAVAVNFDK